MKIVYRSFARAVVAVLLLLGFASAYGQQRIVTGQVNDQSGNAMPGVNEVRKGTSIGTATDGNGSFSIEASDDAALVISSIAYVSQEIRVGSQSNIRVAPSADGATLTAVAAAGHGESRRGELTTA